MRKVCSVVVRKSDGTESTFARCYYDFIYALNGRFLFVYSYDTAEIVRTFSGDAWAHVAEYRVGAKLPTREAHNAALDATCDRCGTGCGDKLIYQAHQTFRSEACYTDWLRSIGG